MTTDEGEARDRATDDGAVGAELVVASVRARLGALVIDDLLVLVVSFVVVVALAFILSAAGVSAGSAESTLVVSLVAEVAIAGYFVGGWRTSHQATPGLRLLGLRVVHATEGRTLALGEAMRRYVFLYGPAAVLALLPGPAATSSALSLLWAAVLLLTTIADPRHRGLHDRSAPSLVVRRAGARIGAAAIAIVGLALLVLILAAIAMIDLVAGAP